MLKLGTENAAEALAIKMATLKDNFMIAVGVSISNCRNTTIELLLVHVKDEDQSRRDMEIFFAAVAARKCERENM